MEDWQEIEQAAIAKLDEAAHLNREDYRLVLNSVLDECESRLNALDEDGEDDEDS